MASVTPATGSAHKLPRACWRLTTVAGRLVRRSVLSLAGSFPGCKYKSWMRFKPTSAHLVLKRETGQAAHTQLPGSAQAKGLRQVLALVFKPLSCSLSPFFFFNSKQMLYTVYLLFKQVFFGKGPPECQYLKYSDSVNIRGYKFYSEYT